MCGENVKMICKILFAGTSLWPLTVYYTPLCSCATEHTLQIMSGNSSLCLFCIYMGATLACLLLLNVTFAAVWNAEGRVTFPASSYNTVLIDDTPCLDGSRRMPPCCHIHDLQPTPVSCASPVKSPKCVVQLTPLLHFTLSFLRCHTLFPLLFSFFYSCEMSGTLLNPCTYKR